MKKPALLLVVVVVLLPVASVAEADVISNANRSYSDGGGINASLGYASPLGQQYNRPVNVQSLGKENADTNIRIDTTDDSHDPRVTVETVPLPGAFWLFGSALVGLVGISRRKRSHR
jgi:hypothetical protein